MELVARKPTSLAVPIAASILLHLMFLPVFSGHPSPISTEHALSPTRLTRVRLIQPKENQNLDSNGQVVDITNTSSVTKEPFKNAQFLSDKNRTVDHETQAKRTGVPKPGEIQDSENNAKPSLGLGAGAGGKLALPQPFLDRDAQTHRQAAISPSNYLPEIAFGDETILNTREYIFAPFFIRMKRQMEANWYPLRWINRYKDQTEQYSTSLEITLKPNGYLERIEIIEPSGNTNLDQEAINAVKQGAPFLNPPEGLVGEEGKIYIGPWRFIVSLSQRF